MARFTGRTQVEQWGKGQVQPASPRSGGAPSAPGPSQFRINETLYAERRRQVRVAVAAVSLYPCVYTAYTILQYLLYRRGARIYRESETKTRRRPSSFGSREQAGLRSCSQSGGTGRKIPGVRKETQRYFFLTLPRVFLGTSR